MPEPVREPDADTLVTLETVQGEVSAAQGYAVPSGETLTTGLGGDNCLVLSENTSVQLFRYGELLEAHLLSGTMSWYLPTPEAMPFALLYCNEALTAELNSLCGYMQYESPDWGIIRSYPFAPAGICGAARMMQIGRSA